MTKEVATAQGGEVGLPNDWQSQLAGMAKEAAASVKPTSSVISLRSGIVSYAGTQAPDNKLDLIVIDFAHEHTYYDKQYDPDNPSNPACFALGEAGHEDKMVPHEVVEAPQHENCADCPLSKWGSDPRGGRGKACQQRFRLVAIPSDVLDSAETVLAAEVATIKLPVTSGKVWSQYLSTVASLHQRPEFGVITTLSAKPDPKTQFKAVFEVKGLVPFEDKPELFQAILQKREMARNVLMKPYDLTGEGAEADEAPATPGKHRRKSS
jgi:hypothetical protein